MRERIERPDFTVVLTSGDEIGAWLDSNWGSVLAYHARPAMVFTEKETPWEDALRAELVAWVDSTWSTEMENPMSATRTAGELWDGFCAGRESGSIRLVVACKCRGRGSTCVTCGPVKGKIVGDVYLRACPQDPT